MLLAITDYIETPVSLLPEAEVRLLDEVMLNLALMPADHLRDVAAEIGAKLHAVPPKERQQISYRRLAGIRRQLWQLRLERLAKRQVRRQAS